MFVEESLGTSLDVLLRGVDREEFLEEELLTESPAGESLSLGTLREEFPGNGLEEFLGESAEGSCYDSLGETLTS